MEQGDHYDYVYSSSSADSIATESNDEGTYAEEVVEDEGERELVLVPGIMSNGYVHEKLDEDFLGGLGYTDFFLDCLSSLRAEELIRRSPRGKWVSLLLDEMKSKNLADIAILLISKASSCITSGYKHRLPTAAQATVWSAFHQCRSDREMKQAWGVFVSTYIPQSSQQEIELALQLLFDRLLKKLLQNKADSKKKALVSSQANSVRQLTATECNAVRYMSGYVAISLLKRYKKPTKNPRLKVKRALFVRVLTGMRAVNQPGEPESVLEYTKQWSDLIDRGGLYHINDKVYHLMELVELVVRQHLNVHNTQVLTSGTDLHQLIAEDVLRSESILSCWETIAYSIPTKYEPYSVELLRAITDLWITVRSHSFARDWTMQFVGKYKKGIRKTLKQN